MQRADPAHERMSLVHVDITKSADFLLTHHQLHLYLQLFLPHLIRPLLDIEIDRLHKRASAHVVQECVFGIRTEQRRVGESECERGFGEGQLGPRTEVPTWRVSVVHRRGECRGTSLFLVRRRMARTFVVDSKVAGEAPDFNVVLVAVKDEIAIFILAVGPGRKVRLGRGPR